MREDAQRSATSLPFTPLRERNNPISAMVYGYHGNPAHPCAENCRIACDAP